MLPAEKKLLKLQKYQGVRNTLLKYKTDLATKLNLNCNDVNKIIYNDPYYCSTDRYYVMSAILYTGVATALIIPVLIKTIVDAGFASLADEIGNTWNVKRANMKIEKLSIDMNNCKGKLFGMFSNCDQYEDAISKANQDILEYHKIHEANVNDILAEALADASLQTAPFIASLIGFYVTGMITYIAHKMRKIFMVDEKEYDTIKPPDTMLNSETWCRANGYFLLDKHKYDSTKSKVSKQIWKKCKKAVDEQVTQVLTSQEVLLARN